MFFHLDMLDSLAQSKCDQGLREEVKKTASRVLPVAKYETVIETYEELQLFGYLDPNLTLTVVHINAALLHYHEVPELVKQKLEEIGYVGKTKLPEKVLVKMLATRFSEVYSVIRKTNGYLNKNYLTDTANHRNIPPPILYEEPVFRTVQGVHECLQSISRKQYMYELVRIYKRMNRDILNKPELTDAVVSQAYDLHMIGGIHES